MRQTGGVFHYIGPYTCMLCSLVHIIGLSRSCSVYGWMVKQYTVSIDMSRIHAYMSLVKVHLSLVMYMVEWSNNILCQLIYCHVQNTRAYISGQPQLCHFPMCMIDDDGGWWHVSPTIVVRWFMRKNASPTIAVRWWKNTVHPEWHLQVGNIV